MDQLPIHRDNTGRVCFEGVGPVSIRPDYTHVLGEGGQGIVVLARVFSGEGSPIREVAVKIGREPFLLEREAAIHAEAWQNLDHVLRPLGFLEAHDASNAPPMLVMEIGLPFETFLSQAGPLSHGSIGWVQAIARVVFQLLRFIVEGDSVNIMHKDIKMGNVFVANTHDPESATLAVGDFGAAQRGEPMAGGGVSYRPGVYTWKHTSPRMAAFVYEGISSPGVKPHHLRLDRQLTFYNDLFGWARIAFQALTDHAPPDTLFGPSAEDYARVPKPGFGRVVDAVRNLLLFSLEVLTIGGIDGEVDAQYVRSLEWFDTISQVLG
eukprot:g7749.t1